MSRDYFPIKNSNIRGNASGLIISSDECEIAFSCEFSCQAVNFFSIIFSILFCEREVALAPKSR